MKTKVLITLLALITLVGGAGVAYLSTGDNEPVAAVTSVTEPVEAPEEPTVEELFRLTNLEREKAGVKPLVLDERLNQSATAKCTDMVEDDYYAHENPRTGMPGYEYIKQQFESGKEAGENLVRGTGDSEALIKGWMSSKSHREAILQTKYSIVGFAICGSDDTTLAVQHFADID